MFNSASSLASLTLKISTALKVLDEIIYWKLPDFGRYMLSCCLLTCTEVKQQLNITLLMFNPDPPKTPKRLEVPFCQVPCWWLRGTRSVRFRSSCPCCVLSMEPLCEFVEGFTLIYVVDSFPECGHNNSAAAWGAGGL